MKSVIIKIILLFTSITFIIYWIINGFSVESNIKQENKSNESESLILKLIYEDTLINIDSFLGSNYISYSDTTAFINILKNRPPINNSIIQDVAVLNTKKFFNFYYNDSIKNLKINNEINSWDSISKKLNKNYDFNINEFSEMINDEIGYFTDNINHYYYFHTNEPYNIISLFNKIKDTNFSMVYEKHEINSVKTEDIFYLINSYLFIKKMKYYVNFQDNFIFSDSPKSLIHYCEKIEKKDFLRNNNTYNYYTSNQFTKYTINYYNHIEEDSLNKIISYQLRGEEKSIISNLSVFRSIDTINFNELSTSKSNLSDQVLNDNINIKEDYMQIESNIDNKVNSLNIKYIISNNETFREATIKLKELLESNSFDYNKVKNDFIYFIIDNGRTKLKWTEATNRYLDKENPKSGDYFLYKND